MTLPLISVITPSFNRADMIRGAIDSVLRQGYPNVEHIIVDGGSSDGTLAALREYPHLKVISEPDGGVYDALNKGIRLAHGDWISQVNSDDRLADGALQVAAQIIESNTAAQAVVGGARIYRLGADGSEQDVAWYPAVQRGELLYRAMRWAPNFNSWFFARSLYDQIGFYDLAYPWAADREFLIRMAQFGVEYIPFDRVVYHYLQHAGSLTIHTDRRKLLKLTAESLGLADRLLRAEQVDVRQAAEDWYIWLCGEQFKLSLRIKEWRGAVRAIRNLWRHQPGWVSRMIWMNRYEVRRLRRGRKRVPLDGTR